jgi:hypothetical protein
VTLDHFIEIIRHLRVDRSGGEPKPYKPLLLAAVVILIHKGEIRSREVYLDGGLKSVFYQLLRKLYPGRFEVAKVAMPYRYLETDRVWKLVPVDGAASGLRAARAGGGAEWQVLKHVRCAELDPEVFDALASSFRSRFRVLQVLIQAHGLPLERTGYLWDLELAAGVAGTASGSRSASVDAASPRRQGRSVVLLEVAERLVVVLDGPFL